MILLTANLKFRNCSTCSKEPMKRAGKVCGDSQDLKSPGYLKVGRLRFLLIFIDHYCQVNGNSEQQIDHMDMMPINVEEDQ